MAVDKANMLDGALSQYLDERPATGGGDMLLPRMPTSVVCLKCPKCGSDMTLRDKRQGNSKFISCQLYPGCKNAIWFPEIIEDVQVLNDMCEEVKILNFLELVEIISDYIPFSSATSYTK